MPYDRQIPDSPMPVSMLPRVAGQSLTLNDLLYLVQPGNNPGQRSKSLDLDTLRGFIWGEYGNFNRIKRAERHVEGATMALPYPYLDIPLIEVPPGYCMGAVDLDLVCTDSVGSSDWDGCYVGFSAGVGTYSPVVPGDYTKKYPLSNRKVIVPDKFVSNEASGNPHFTVHFTPQYKNEGTTNVVFRILLFGTISNLTTTNWNFNTVAECLIPETYESVTPTP